MGPSWKPGKLCWELGGDGTCQGKSQGPHQAPGLETEEVVVPIRGELQAPWVVGAGAGCLSFRGHWDTQVEMLRRQLDKGEGSAREMEQSDSEGK